MPRKRSKEDLAKLVTNDKSSKKSPQRKPTSVNFSRLAEKLNRSGVPYSGPDEPLAGPLAEVAAGGYVMHSGVSPSRPHKTGSG